MSSGSLACLSRKFFGRQLRWMRARFAPNDNETLCSRGLAARQVSEPASVRRNPHLSRPEGDWGFLRRAYDYRLRGAATGSTILFRWGPLACYRPVCRPRLRERVS